MDAKAKIRGTSVATVEGILRNASASRKLCVFILYNLPNRDCNAKASSGEKTVCTCWPSFSSSSGISAM